MGVEPNHIQNRTVSHLPRPLERNEHSIIGHCNWKQLVGYPATPRGGLFMLPQLSAGVVLPAF